MKNLFMLLVLALGMIACVPQNPAPANPTPNADETMLLGNWELTGTWQYDIQTDTLVQIIPPWTTGCGAQFYNTINSNYSVDPLQKYNAVWKGHCATISAAWSISNDTLYVNHIPYILLYLGGDTLILDDVQNPGMELHFTKP